VVALAFAPGNDNWQYKEASDDSDDSDDSNTIQIGYWDVDDGGAEGDGIPLGNAYINLSGIKGPMSSQKCIEDIQLGGGTWGEKRNPPIGYTAVGWWDVDSGGSLDSNKKSTTDRMTLFIKRMDETDNPPEKLKVISDIGMVITNNKPEDNSPDTRKLVQGYKQVGWWDVDRLEGCGFINGQSRCGTYAAQLLTKRVDYVNAKEVQTITLLGRWQTVNACRGGNCSESSFEISVGAEQGKELSKSSTEYKSLSTMIGVESTVGSGDLAPVDIEVTAKVEVTGEISSEQQDAIMDSFSISRQSTAAVVCSGPSVMWQWVSTLKIERATSVEDVQAPSLLTVCAPKGVKPPHANDISWDPEETPQKVSAPSSEIAFKRGGERTFLSPSGDFYAALQLDGNFVVKTKADAYVWGLNEVVMDQLPRITSVVFRKDGNLVALADDGAVIWSALQNGQQPGSALRLTDEGVLRIVGPDEKVIWTPRG